MQLGSLEEMVSVEEAPFVHFVRYVRKHTSLKAAGYWLLEYNIMASTDEERISFE